MSLRTLTNDLDALAHCRAVDHFCHIQSICPGGATHFYPGASAPTLICLLITPPTPLPPLPAPTSVGGEEVSQVQGLLPLPWVLSFLWCGHVEGNLREGGARVGD